MQEKPQTPPQASLFRGCHTRATPPCQLDDAALVPLCFASSRCGWSPYAGKATDSSTSKLVPESMAFPAHGSSGFHMIIQTIPPLLSLTIFCMVSWSFTWHSSPIMEILLVIPSLTSCSTVFSENVGLPDAVLVVSGVRDIADQVLSLLLGPNDGRDLGNHYTYIYWRGSPL